MTDDEPILKRLLKSRSVFIVNSLVIFSIVVGLGRTFWNNYYLKKEINALQAEARELETKSLEISKLKDYFTSPDFLEAEARLKLGLQKPGEETVIVEGAPEALPQEEEAIVKSEEPEDDGRASANLKKWWKHFFH